MMHGKQLERRPPLMLSDQFVLSEILKLRVAAGKEPVIVGDC
jgi:hypothetical protein